MQNLIIQNNFSLENLATDGPIPFWEIEALLLKGGSGPHSHYWIWGLWRIWQQYKVSEHPQPKIIIQNWTHNESEMFPAAITLSESWNFATVLVLNTHMHSLRDTSCWGIQHQSKLPEALRLSFEILNAMNHSVFTVQRKFLILKKHNDLIVESNAF